MRVGIYNRWLATLGGGEKHVLAIAEHLSKNHQVEVISHTDIDKQYAASRLNLDLSQVNFIVLPDLQNKEISELTKNYDFFINGSYQDFFTNYAPRSATLIFFPARLGGRESLSRRLKKSLRRIFDVPQIAISPQGFNASRSIDGWQMVPPLEFYLSTRHTPYQMTIDLQLENCSIEQLQIVVNNIIAEYDYDGNDQLVHLTLQIPRLLQEPDVAIKIFCNPDNTDFVQLPKIIVKEIHLDTFGNRVYKELIQKVFTSLGVYLEYSPSITSVLTHLDTYSAIWVNSKFTQQWTAQYWNRPSKVLYPPINVDNSVIGEKTENILNVGRFFAGQHNKKHVVMIETFKRMVDHGLEGWTLNMVGGSTPGKEHEDYLKDLYKRAQGYPISIYPDLSHQKLKELYAKSMIYWHASGYGENSKRAPEKMEHFGITTVEGMAAGCVPIVINKGGQPEIVRHQVSGFLWNDLDELQNYTLQVIHNDKLRQNLAAQAVIDSKNYDYQHFNDRVDQLCEEIGIPSTGKN